MTNELKMDILKMYDTFKKFHPEEITEFRLLIKTKDAAGNIVITNFNQIAGFIETIQE
jgi:hypothetical protein